MTPDIVTLKKKLRNLNEFEQHLYNSLSKELIEKFKHEFKLPTDILAEYCAVVIKPDFKCQYSAEQHNNALTYLALFLLTLPNTLGDLGKTFTKYNGKKVPDRTPLNLGTYIKEVILTKTADLLGIAKRGDETVPTYSLPENVIGAILGTTNTTLLHFLSPKLNELKDNLNLEVKPVIQAAKELRPVMTDEVLSNEELSDKVLSNEELKVQVKKVSYALTTRPLIKTNA